MTIKRWGVAFIQLGALLLAIGLIPALFTAVFMPADPAPMVALLSLSVAPLGAVCFLLGLVLWLIGLARK